MKNNFISQILVAIVLIAFIVIIWNPWHLLMGKGLEMMLVILMAAAFVAFAALVWLERPADERESYNVMFSDRVAFITGAAALASIMAYDVLAHRDPKTIALALGIMVATKLISHSFKDRS